MTKWTALVPVRSGGKTRLGQALDAKARSRLIAAMRDHVLGVLSECAELAEIVVLSPSRPAGWAGR